MEKPAAPEPSKPTAAVASKRRTPTTQVLLVVGSIAGLILAGVIIREMTPMRTMLRSLRSSDEAVRREAATNLGDLSTVDIGTAIPALGVAMVTDPSAEVRAEATQTMGTLGGESVTRRDAPRRDQALGALLAACDDKDPKVRAAAMSMIIVLAHAATLLSGNDYDLAPIGAPRAVVAKLLPILQGPDENLRSAAANALGYFPVELDASLPMLLKAAAEEAPPAGRGRGVVAGLLAKVRPLATSVPLLLDALKSADPKARSLAITTLGHANGDAVDAVPELIKILNDPAGAGEPTDPGRAAATALGEIAPGTPRAIETMAALQEARSSAPKGRERAITAALKGFEPAP